MVFISLIVAPDFKSSRLTACLSSSVMPSIGSTNKDEPPPRDQAEHGIVGGEVADRFENAPRGEKACGVGYRVRRFDDLDALAR